MKNFKPILTAMSLCMALAAAAAFLGGLWLRVGIYGAFVSKYGGLDIIFLALLVFLRLTGIPVLDLSLIHI